MTHNKNRIIENHKVFDYRRDDPRDFVSKEFLEQIDELKRKYKDVLERLRYE